MDTWYIRKKTAFLLALILILTVVTPYISLKAEETVSADLMDTPSGNQGTPSGNTGTSVSGDSTVSGDEDTPAGEEQPLEEKVGEGIVIRSLSSDFTKPSVFLTKKTIKLNGLRREDRDETWLMINVDGDYELKGLGSGGGLSLEGQKTSYNGLPAFHITVSSTSASFGGTYRYDLSVLDRKSGRESGRVRLTVAVKKKNPVAKWKKSLVTLNISGKDEAALNSPDVPGVSIAPVSGNAKYKALIPKCVNVSLINENTVKITRGPGMELNKKYTVQLWMIYADSTAVSAVRKKFSVMLTDKDSSVSFKKQKDSSLDLSERNGTALHYAPSAKNSGFLIKDLRFRDPSLSVDYILDKRFDEDTGELSDIYLRARNGASISKGTGEYFFDTETFYPGSGQETSVRSASFRAARKTSKLKLAFVSGNTLKINETLSDNKIAGTIEVRVQKPRFAAVDPGSIRDITSDSGKVPKGTFTASFVIDSHGQAVRIRIVADKAKLTSGKNYDILFSMKAKGASPDTAATKLKIRYKAP